MKKIFLGCLALLASASLWAENELTIEEFTIAAGEEVEANIILNNDDTFTAFQLNIELPAGVSVKYDEDEEAYCVGRTGRLLSSHNIVSQYQDDGTFKIMVYNNSNKNLKNNSGTILTLTLLASDQVETGTLKPALTKRELTAYNSSTLTTTKTKLDDTTYTCKIKVETKVTTLGYASFSWPKALDFSNSGLTAFIATSCNGKSVKLEPVTKVPANTGLILKGTAGSENTYELETTEGETEDVSANLLSSNTEGEYTVASNDIYVLSNLHEGKAGFYPAEQGVHVAQYKAYLEYDKNQTRIGITLDEDMLGISTTSTDIDASGEFYDLQGRRVENPSKGIYIVNGKKIIVK